MSTISVTNISNTHQNPKIKKYKNKRERERERERERVPW
jgi:hypothetical protein